MNDDLTAIIICLSKNNDKINYQLINNILNKLSKKFKWFKLTTYTHEDIENIVYANYDMMIFKTYKNI